MVRHVFFVGFVILKRFDFDFLPISIWTVYVFYSFVSNIRIIICFFQVKTGVLLITLCLSVKYYDFRYQVLLLYFSHTYLYIWFIRCIYVLMSYLTIYSLRLWYQYKILPIPLFFTNYCILNTSKETWVIVSYVGETFVHIRNLMYGILFCI